MLRTTLLVVVFAACAASARAQSKPDTLPAAERTDHTRMLTFGASAGAMHFGDGGHERAMSAALGIALPHGFSLSVNPTYAWAQAAPTIDAITGRSVMPAQVQGMADLPVGIGYSHALPGPGSPGFYASLGATLPTGDTTAVGGGETSFGANFGVWMEAGAGWSLGAGAGHTLSNGYASGLGSIAPTTVSLSASHGVGPASMNIGYSTEMGAMPAGTTHSQNFSGGASVPLGGALALNVSGSLGRADGTQSWALAAGLGTTFADVAQVTPFAAVGQLASALGMGRSLGKSRSAAAKAAVAARKAGKKKG